LLHSLDFSKLLSYSLVDGSLSLVSPSETALETSGAVVAACGSDVLTLFLRLLPVQFFAAALEQAGVKENNRVYNSAVVV
jgi:hypothetical protein